MNPEERPLVYVAGPMFNDYEHQNQSDIDEALRRGGFRTYLPQADGLIFGNLVHKLKDAVPEMTVAKLHEYQFYVSKAIFAIDIFQVVHRCDCLVFNMNGLAPDAGSTAEAALAYTAGKPTVAFDCDARSLLHGIENPLVWGLALEPEHVVRNVKDVPARLWDVIWHHQNQGWRGSTSDQLPGSVKKWIHIGQAVWELRNTDTWEEEVENDIMHMLEQLSEKMREHNIIAPSPRM